MMMMKRGHKTYSEPLLSILGLYLLAVAEPVAVPAPDSSRVVDTDSINSLELESSALELVDNEAKGSASVGAREDVLVHEKTPEQVLVLPSFTDTSNLQEEHAIIVQQVVDLREEGREVTHTDVLRHL